MDVNTLKWIQLIQTIVLFVLPALVVAWFVGKKHPIAWLRLNRGVRWTTAILAMVMVVVAVPGINLLSYLNQQMQLPACVSGLEAWMQQQEEAAAYVTELMVHADTVWMLLLNIGLMAVLPAFGEELTFRGALQGWIGGVTEEKRITTRQHVAVWIVAVLFSAIHMQFYGFVPRMLLGAWFGYMLLWSGSLWLPMLMHMTNNAIAVLGYYWVEQKGIDPESIDALGTGDTLWLGITSLVVTVLGIVAFRLQNADFSQKNEEKFA